MVSSPENPQNASQNDRREKRKFPLLLVTAGAVLLLLAVPLFLYVFFYQPKQQEREFESHIDHPSQQESALPTQSKTAQRPERTLQTQQRRVNQAAQLLHHAPEAKPSQTPTVAVAPCVATAPDQANPPKKANFFKRFWNAVRRFFGGSRTKPISENKAPVICSLVSSLPAVELACPNGMNSQCSASAAQPVRLSVAAADAEGDPLRYTWSVTAGKITGEGPQVEWDLLGAKSGPHTATVTVSDERGHSVEATSQVTVVVCTLCEPPHPACPELDLIAEDRVAEGSADFVATLSFPASVTYHWTISAGTIIKGQGTESITVDTRGLLGRTVTATVELGGLNPSCSLAASRTTSIEATAEFLAPTRIARYGDLPFASQKPLLDRFAQALRQKPNTRASIIAYGTYGGDAAKRARQARRYLVSPGGISAARISIVDGGCRNEGAMELWLAPPGVSIPGPSMPGEISPCPDNSDSLPMVVSSAHVTLSGTVRGPDEQKIGNAKVVAYAEDGTRHEAFTDRNGSFYFADLDAGTYRLEISAAGFGTLTISEVDVKNGHNVLPDSLKLSLHDRTIRLQEQDVIRVEYPERFLKDKTGEVAFIFDRRLAETPIETSETNTNGKIAIEEKAPPVPGATPEQPYYKAQGGVYTVYATVTIIPTGLSVVEGPTNAEQSLVQAPVNWSWKLKLIDDTASQVSFRFHVALVWKAAGLPDKSYAYDWEKTFTAEVGAPTSVTLATYGYRGFGGGGFGLVAMGSIRKRRKRGPGVAAAVAEETMPDEVTDEVATSVYAPRQAVAGDSFLVQVFAHLPGEDANALTASATAADPSAQALGSEPLQQAIKRGATLSFTLIMDNLTIDRATQNRVWNGKTIRVQFGVIVPEDAKPRSMFGTVVVCEDGEPVGDFRFAFKVLASAAQKTNEPVSLEAVNRYQNTFISYSHEDREEVLKRVQMLRLMRRDYFMDIMSLKLGEDWKSKLNEYMAKCDCFILFWSSAAQHSDWVNKEINLAIARQAGNREAPPKIYAVPIEGPPAPTPPEALNYLQFDDEINYLIFANKATSNHDS